MTRIIEEGEVRIQGAEATDGILGLYSDQGDDDADKWRITKYASTENLNFEYWDGTTWQTAFALVREGNVNQTLLFPSLYIRQLISAPTFTKPVLQLEQTDLSEEFIEFDSLINIRPSHGNSSRGVEDEETRRKIISIVAKRIIR